MCIVNRKLGLQVGLNYRQYLLSSCERLVVNKGRALACPLFITTSCGSQKLTGNRSGVLMPAAANSLGLAATHRLVVTGAISGEIFPPRRDGGRGPRTGLEPGHEY